MRARLFRHARHARAFSSEVLVYGANTDVGKTVVSAALCRWGLVRGPVSYVKPVQTGEETDAEAVARHAGQLTTETLYHYPSPESPATAAEKAQVRPPGAGEFQSALRRSLEKAKEQSLCVVETAGGPLSPGPDHSFQADLYAPLQLPCLLVGDPHLGGISATACAFQALEQRGQRPLAVVLFEDVWGNAEALRRALDAPVLELPKPPPKEEPLKDWLELEAVGDSMEELLGIFKVDRGWREEHLQVDRKHLWHPYTSMAKPGPVWSVDSAQGCRLRLEDGRELVDGMASWWCAIHGYNVPELNRAATKQIAKMSHVMFGGLTHRPATDLAQLLVECAPPGLTQVFLCDSGSVSVEVALKMSLQYWAMKGREKRRIATVQRGYHGDTFGAMAVCDPVRGMHSLFTGSLAQQLFAEAPRLCSDWSADAEDGFESMQRLVEQHHEELAAVIIEPVVQGAGGMRIYHPSYLRKLRKLCDDWDVLLIFDEIATGFGRTGKLFAAEHAQVSPDIMCIGKALTGGYCTLGATLATEKVGHGVSGADGLQPMMHGPTFMGNPLACSIAAASIRLLLDGPWQSRVMAIEAQLRESLRPLAALEAVQDVRALGAIGVVELKEPPKRPQELQAALVGQGVWLRPFGQTIYTMPPFVISPTELQRICDAIKAVLQA